MTKSPESKESVKTTGHIYDGIEELDHAPPMWFRATFYISIVFSACYMFYYTLGDGPSLNKEYANEKLTEELQQLSLAAQSGGAKLISEDEFKTLAKDPARKASGLAVFQSKCVSCHGDKGQGGIGPNLTDEYWLHGGKLTEIQKTIVQGVAEKGMPPWGPTLKAEEIQSLTVFIRTLAGSHPSGAKAPQGTLVKTE